MNDYRFKIYCDSEPGRIIVITGDYYEWDVNNKTLCIYDKPYGEIKVKAMFNVNNIKGFVVEDIK